MPQLALLQIQGFELANDFSCILGGREHGAEQVWIVYRKTKTVKVMTSEGTKKAGMGETLRFHGVAVAVDSICERRR